MKYVYARGETQFGNLDEAYRFITSLPSKNESVFLHAALNAVLFKDDSLEFDDPVSRFDALFFVKAVLSLVRRKALLNAFVEGSLSDDVSD